MTCKDCIHFNVCGVCQKAFLSLDKIENECIALKDKSRFVALPCEIEDSVFVIPTNENGRKEITPMVCLGFSLGYSNNVANCFDEKNKLFQPSFEEFGKTVFLSIEEAEKALEWLKTK